MVSEGCSALNTVALTGEALPRDVAPGDTVVNGCVNQTGLLRITVSRPYAQSTVAKILELTEQSATRKAKSEAFITRFARVYTPFVVVCAVLLAVIPPLCGGGDVGDWLYRALTFLVVSCPCALVISVPLTFFSGIGGASRRGILVKGANYLEELAAMDTVVLDKTGTLTEGSFTVQEVISQGMDSNDLLYYAALAESRSHHPIAVSLREAYQHPLPKEALTEATERAGYGVCATIEGQAVAVGNARLMAQCGVTEPLPNVVGTAVYVAVNGEYAGHITIADTVKSGAKEALSDLRRNGVRRLVMLSGDRAETAQAVADRLGIDEVHAELLPDQKVQEVERLLSTMPKGGKLVFVGDGVNDAPVLRRADIGVAMGAMGADAAIEAADVVLMDDKLSRLCEAVRLSRRTRRIVRQNIAFALGVKGAVLLCGALGLTGMWLAVFADVGVAVLAILNAMRALQAK